VLYLDANIFVYAALNTEEYGSRALSLLKKIQQGEEQAITSALTFDESFWAVKKSSGIEKAIEAGEVLLNFPNLDIISTDRELISSALQLTKECNLNPRNAIHAATAIDKRADVFISTDPHFDKLKRLKRKTL
jgi:uncharacterized protein